MDLRRDFAERCAPWGTKDALHGASDNELVTPQCTSRCGVTSGVTSLTTPDAESAALPALHGADNRQRKTPTTRLILELELSYPVVRPGVKNSP